MERFVMKKLKRLLTIGVAVALMFCISLSFVGCKEEPVIGPIPDGKYVYASSYGAEGYEYRISTYIYAENSDSEYYWEIEGDHASQYASNSLVFKAKIVNKNEKIYFEGYQWDDFLHNLGNFFMGKKAEKLGYTDIYPVEYNEQEKSITINYN